LLLVAAQFLIEVFAVRTRGHGEVEDGLHDEAVVGLERVAVGGAEGDRELVAGGGEVLREGLGGEIESAEEGLVRG
jgi:hypothetical protein